MARGAFERKIRNAHRWVGIASLSFLLLSVGTGLLWANAKFLYWDEHYKEKVRKIAGPPLEAARMSLQEVMDRGHAAVDGPASVEQVTLRSDFGRLLYDIRLRAGGKTRTLLFDAITGEALSPISTDLARDIARQYVSENAEVTAVATEPYTPRKKHKAQEAIRVGFNDTNRTEIVLDSHTGEILEDEGRWRQFHFFVMQLHQLNFFGFEKTLLNVPGIPLLMMGLTGLFLWCLQAARTRRARHAHQKESAPTAYDKRVAPHPDRPVL